MVNPPEPLPNTTGALFFRRTDYMIKVKVGGSFKKTEAFLQRNKRMKFKSLDKYGKEGVQALAAATPVDTGLTAASWYYEIVQNKDTTSIVWKNSNVVNGVPIAIILQYGHATRNGGYVQGTEYINSALRPVFEKIADSVWKEVTKG